MEYADTLGVVELKSGPASEFVKILKALLDLRLTERSLVKHWDQGENGLSDHVGRVLQLRGVEQAEEPTVLSVASLNPLAPPLTEVGAVTEDAEQLRLVVVDPSSKPEVVVIRGDETFPGLGSDGWAVGGILEGDRSVSAVNLLGYDDRPKEPCRLGPCLKFHLEPF